MLLGLLVLAIVGGIGLALLYFWLIFIKTKREIERGLKNEKENRERIGTGEEVESTQRRTEPEPVERPTERKRRVQVSSPNPVVVDKRQPIKPIQDWPEYK